MDRIWELLELEPTRDVSAIRRAYAQKSRICHPEEDPEGFLELRKAYQAALDYAEGNIEGTEEPSSVPGGEPEDEGWDLTERSVLLDEGPNPFDGGPAACGFLELYTGRQRKDSQKWLDYFTSDMFLHVAWERRFAALLLAKVTHLEGEYPVNREFLNWLCVAYQFHVDRAVYQNPDGSERTEFHFQIHTGAQFEGQEFIFEIATKGPAPRQKKGSELAVFNSFTDYHRLMKLAETGRWNERDLNEAGNILEYYMIGNVQDKNPRGSERHPAGIRLINHFFQQDGLPKTLYTLAWQKLELKTALMGKAKLLYGKLRERVLEQVPDVAEGDMNFIQLNKDFESYRLSVCGLEKSGRTEDLARAEEETAALFARADFQRALWNRRFVENCLLYHVQWSGDHFAEAILAFYARNPDAPCAEQVIWQIGEARRRRELERRLQEDQVAPVLEGMPTLVYRPFFRHWLNTGFYQARDPESGRTLLDYLNQELPYLPEWSKKFVAAAEEGVSSNVLAYTTDGDAIEVRFHLRYMEFYRNQTPVYRPCLAWERVAEWTDTDLFFFFLPITVTTYDQYETVKAELLRRLADTAAPEDDRAFLAACLAEQVCRLPVPGEAGLGWEMDEEEPEVRSLPAESVLPFALFAEDEDHLYGCEWNQRSQALFLFEQFPIGRHMLRDGLHDGVTDPEAAVALAQQLLEETLRPPKIPVERLANLPDAVYSRPDFNVVCRDQDAPPLWSRPVELLGEAVTATLLEELLELFFSDRVDRLELSWDGTIPVGEEQDYGPRRSLVLLKGGGGYACLYFDDFRAESYALLEKPELYGKLKDKTEFVPFRQARLFSSVFHRKLSSIRRRLDLVFRQAGWPGGVRPEGVWSYAVNVNHGRHKYNLDKQLLGDFPMERAHNRADAPFYFSLYPNSAACVDGQGGVETLTVGDPERPRLQQMMARFLRDGCPKLRLTWGKEEGRRRHIVLLQEGGRFLMVWLLEEKRTAEYHVADVWTYMDVEGKKYPKDTFQGRVTPAYLIHSGVVPLRNALELLLAHMEEPSVITGKFAEYAGEKPVKPRPYEIIWAELVGDTLP